MATRKQIGRTSCWICLAFAAVALVWWGLHCYSSAAPVADARDGDAREDGSVVPDVEGQADAEGGGDGLPDAESELDAENPDRPDTDAVEDAPGPDETPPDGFADVPDAWDVTPFVPEALDCTGRNDCYVELEDGGIGCELPDYVAPRISCEVEFEVWGFGRPGIDWGAPIYPEGEPFPGRTMARDGTEAVALVTWYDALSYSLEDWGAACRGHCPYYFDLTLSGGYYLIHLPTGVLLDATARPEESITSPAIPPEYEIDGWTPEGYTGWYYRDSPEFDVRYMWRMETVELPFTYEGSVIPAAIHRRRLSTGEELPPIDLPLLP